MVDPEDFIRMSKGGRGIREVSHRIQFNGRKQFV